MTVIKCCVVQRKGGRKEKGEEKRKDCRGRKKGMTENNQQKLWKKCHEAAKHVSSHRRGCASPLLSSHGN